MQLSNVATALLSSFATTSLLGNAYSQEKRRRLGMGLELEEEGAERAKKGEGSDESEEEGEEGSDVEGVSRGHLVGGSLGQGRGRADLLQM